MGFAVPLNLYSVEWKDPDNKPIKFRTADDPVQGEPAFDPFAMMDEQPNSAKTRVNLFPTEKLQELQGLEAGQVNTRKLMGPMSSTLEHAGQKLLITRTEYIGCCGFPC